MEPWIDLLSTHAVTTTVLAVAVALLSRVIRHAAIVHALWVIVLLKLLTPPIFEVAILPASESRRVLHPQAVAASQIVASPSSVVSLPELGNRHNATLIPNSSKPEHRSIPWTLGLALILGGGSLTVLGLTLTRIRRFRGQLEGVDEAPPAIRQRVGDLAARFGLKRLPRTLLVPARISPMLWPRGARTDLLVPTALLERLSTAELDAVLSHELAHLRRRDHWVRFLELGVTVLFWWHPVVWWARRQLRQVEERSCDAWVAHVLPRQARAYAEGLLKTMEFLAEHTRPLPIVGTGLQTRHDMKERLTMILTHKTPRILTSRHRLLLAVLALVILVIVPTRAPRADGQATSATIHEKQLREQELELERRGLALKSQMRELEAERHELEYRREVLEREAKALELDAKAREFEQAGQTLEAELHRERRAALEQDNELVRERYEQQLAYELKKREIKEQVRALKAVDPEEAAKLEARIEQEVKEFKHRNELQTKEAKKALLEKERTLREYLLKIVELETQRAEVSEQERALYTERLEKTRRELEKVMEDQ